MNKGRMPALACGPFLLVCAIMAGCADSDSPTAEQIEQLNRAEEMLNEAPADLSGIDANALGELQPRPEDAAPRAEEPR
ncbi:MAG TPA: hypothetical protein VFO51_07230 [Sphingomicrobium sp.]|nr:hypothetical protein [Sphingomicrobium sp.]